MTKLGPAALAVAISLSGLVALGLLGYAVSTDASLPALPEIISLSRNPISLPHLSAAARPLPPTATDTPSLTPTVAPAPFSSSRPSPVHTIGKFTIAPGTSPRIGTGSLRRYQVAVEDGVFVGAVQFAEAVDETLGDRRSWTASRRWSLARVGPGVQSDFVVRLATPATVDRICGAAGLETMGQVSCQAGSNVMINLRRWQLAIPAYADHVRDYQHLVVNHEVGHFLGLGHASCPAKGAPAPAMMPQYFGLGGCRPNPWPFPDSA